MRLQFTQESDFRRERDFGQKIAATFEFIGAHWRPLGRVLLYLVLPAALLQSIVSVLLQRQMQGAVQGVMQTPGLGGAMAVQRSMFSTIFSSPIYWLNSLIGTILVTLLVLSIYGYVVQLLHRRTPGPEVTVAEVWAVVRREFLGTFFSSWGVGLLIAFGFVFLVLPGIYLAVGLSLFFIVKLAEGKGFSDSISRSLSLTRGKWWSTCGLLFIMLMLVYVLIFGLGIAATLLSGGFSAIVHATQNQSPLFTIILTSINSLILLLLYPPLLLVLAFQYFNLVERKDGVGLRRMVDALGQAPAPQASNAAYRPDDEGEY